MAFENESMHEELKRSIAEHSLIDQSSFNISNISQDKLTFPEQILFTTFKDGLLAQDIPYMLSEELGSGYTATVYMCRNAIEPYGIIGAMKIFTGNKDEKYWKREAESLMKINHPNAVKILECGNRGHTVDCKLSVTKSNLHYILMEYVTGGCLTDIQNLIGPMNEGGGRFFMEQMCPVLSFLHSQDMCHRDLKPENIMLDNLCNIKVADFGFLSTDAKGISKHKTHLGTKCYMAPEIPRVHLRDQQYYDGRKVDVFSLGLTLLNIVTDKTLIHDASNPKDQKYRYIMREEYHRFWDMIDKDLYAIFLHQTESKITFEQFKSPLSESLKDLISKMICYDEEKRLTIEEVMKHPWMQQPFKMHAYRK